jgi:hypothetical protein
MQMGWGLVFYFLSKKKKSIVVSLNFSYTYILTINMLVNHMFIIINHS